jgi:hypothetical protein
MLAGGAGGGSAASNRAQLRAFHAAAWGGSGLLLAGALLEGGLGAAGNWCWVRRDMQLLRLLCWFVPMLLMLAVNVAVYCRVAGVNFESTRRFFLFAGGPRVRLDALRIRLNSTSSSSAAPASSTAPLAADGRPAPAAGGAASGTQGALSAAIRGRLRLYLLVFITVQTSTVVVRVVEWSRGAQGAAEGGGPGAAPFWLYFVHAVLVPLQGFGNALVYGATRVLRLEYAKLFARRGGGGGGCCCRANGGGAAAATPQCPPTPPTPTSLAQLSRGRLLEQEDGYNEL